MIRSLRTGVSGLKSHQTRMDVVGNNIANVNTIAFKRGRAAFGEVLGQEMLGVGRTAGGTGINPSYIGLGVAPGSIDQNWGQGSLESTGIQTDLALNGDGFFIARAGERQMLTRAGNFTFNRDGEFVTNNGLNVQGWKFDDEGSLVTGALQDIKIDPNAQAPAKRTDNVFVGGNLSADAALGDTTSVSTVVYDSQGKAHNVIVDFERMKASGQYGETEDVWQYTVKDADGNPLETGNTIAWNSDPILTSWDPNSTVPTVGGTFNSGVTGGVNRDYTFSVADAADTTTPEDGIIDEYTVNWEGSDGNSGTLTVDAATGAVTYDAGTDIDGLTFDFAPASGSVALAIGDTFTVHGREKELVGGTMKFDENGDIEPQTPNSDGEEVLTFDWDMDGDGIDDPLTLNFGAPGESALTQYSGSTTATIREQDGRASGSLAGYSINPEGVLELNFTNGEQQKLFQLALGTVNNPGGLEQQGENFYTTSSASGDLQLGRAGRDVSTAVVAGTLEMSNVDLATEFTDMIVAQRGYQASARVITTSDELMQETVQLKR